jgi:hypothetical protein
MLSFGLLWGSLVLLAVYSLWQHWREERRR